MNTFEEENQMNAGEQFCSNPHCAMCNQLGQGNIVVHSKKARRYKCKSCGKTFVERKGSAYYRLHKDGDQWTQVVTLLSWGCPVQAIVAAFGWDERTVTLVRSGEHCQKLHEQQVLQQQLDLHHVQADELRAKGRGIIMWLAMALMVSSRLWLGGVASPKRDRHLADNLMQLVVKAAAPLGVVLVAVDGWAAYPKAIVRAFRQKVPREAGQREVAA